MATSPATEQAAQALGLTVAALDALGELDIAIDGADQIEERGWLVKGGGAAQTREKIVAAASRRFVVIASAEKAVSALHPPVPLEVLRFGAMRTLTEVGEARLRGDLESPDGEVRVHHVRRSLDVAEVRFDRYQPSGLAQWCQLSVRGDGGGK